MKIHVTAIQNKYLRRTAMIAAPLLLYPAIFIIGALKGVLDLTESLGSSWGPAWRGEPSEPVCAQVGVRGGQLMIHMPIDVLAFAAEHAPDLELPDARVEDCFRVTDRKVFAEAVAHALRREEDDDGSTLLHKMIDAAIERVVNDGEEGFVWPAAGIKGD